MRTSHTQHSYRVKECVFLLQKEKRESNHMFLVIEFPHFHVKEEEYRVVHYERVSPS